MRNARQAKKKLDAVAKKIGYRKLHYLVLSRMLNKEFEGMSVKFRFYTQPRRPTWGSYLIFSGGYNQPGDGDFRYNVDICRDPTESPYIKPRRGFFTETYLVLVHEFRHGYQYRTRRFKKPRRKDVSFFHPDELTQERVRDLSDYDEIDAYAAERAEELRIGHKSTDGSLDRYELLKIHAPKVWKRFQKKVYLFSHK